MSRPRGIPSYRKHRQSGLAIVTLTDALAKGRKGQTDDDGPADRGSADHENSWQ
jgi:hypothetical protein